MHNKSNKACFKQSTLFAFCIFLFCAIFGLLFMSSLFLGRDKDSIMPNTTMILVGFGLVIIALIAFLKALWTWAMGLTIVISEAKISAGPRLGYRQETDFGKVSWHYVPFFPKYITGEQGPFKDIWDTLYIQTGLFMKFPDNKYFRLCPGVFRKKKAKALLELLSKSVGPIPDFAINIVDASKAERVWETTVWQKDDVVTVGTGENCMIKVQRGDEDIICKIEYQPNDQTFLVTNVSQHSEIEYDYTAEFPQILHPGESKTLRHTETQGKDSSIFNLNSGYILFCEALTDNVLHKWRLP